MPMLDYFLTQIFLIPFATLTPIVSEKKSRLSNEVRSTKLRFSRTSLVKYQSRPNSYLRPLPRPVANWCSITTASSLPGVAIGFREIVSKFSTSWTSYDHWPNLLPPSKGPVIFKIAAAIKQHKTHHPTPNPKCARNS